MTGNDMNCPPAPAGPDRRRRWLHALRTGCRFLLAAVFLMAALTKITDLAGFEDQIVLHAGLPSGLDITVVHILPWLELTCGACLALGYASREAALVTAVLLAAFIVHGLFNFAERDCGCFLFPGLLAVSPPWWQPARNVLLLAASILVTLNGKRPISAVH
jgi:uncharacterized membrane protein YphA (DoxX/SURF4 family)